MKTRSIFISFFNLDLPRSISIGATVFPVARTPRFSLLFSIHPLKPTVIV